MPPKRNRETAQETDSLANKTTVFKNLVIAIAGTFSITQTAFLKLLEDNGATSTKTVTKSSTHLISTVDDVKNKSTSYSKAKQFGIPIVSESWARKSIDNKSLCDTKDYSLDTDDAEEEEEEEEEKEGEEKMKVDTKKTTTTTTTTTTTRPKRTLTKKEEKEEEEEEKEEEEEESDEESKTKHKVAKNSQSMTIEEFDSDLDGSDSEDESNHATATIKNGAAVDQYCIGIGSWHVYAEGNDIFDATLNQTEINKNNNKFYIIQLLEHDNNKSYKLLNRWGREGLKGIVKEFPGTLSELKADFCKKFHDKTKNNFYSRKNFKKVSGKYDMVELDYSTDNSKTEKAEKKKRVEHKKECSLPDPVQDLIRLIFDVSLMKNTMHQAKYDLKKMPLGKLSKNQIMKGYEVLKSIESHLLGKSKEDLTALSSAFYTAIPHVFGMRTPPVINTMVMVKDKMTMLENLTDMKIATTLIKEANSDESNILEGYYKQLKTNIEPLAKDHEDYETIMKYVVNTYQGKTPAVINIFTIDREGEKSRFEPSKKLGNRKLLWHGSRLTNYVGILSTGLRIAPKEAPVSGYRFGKGIYFADIMSLSANYCRSYGTDDFCMLLGEVSLGKTADLYQDTYMEQPQPGSHSTLALGMIEPHPDEDHSHKDGYVVPYGKITNSKYPKTSCKEHQYVVYDVDQVNLKYLLQLRYSHN